ncbi:hypothetical protein BURK2_00075 [Burkholderiales bacterium]|nr:MAG: type II toxin-antitoxin system RelE/ParE family toxin [Burkholderiales bacterium]CAG0949042.1 hypothetical protein BURK2_00075 [Burkholderiales bacterium]
MGFEVEFDPEAVKDPRKLDREVQKRILRFLKDRVAMLADPRQLGEALAGNTLGNYWKYRVGDWRIICDIEDRRIIVRVLRIGNRREIYR